MTKITIYDLKPEDIETLPEPKLVPGVGESFACRYPPKEKIVSQEEGSAGPHGPSHPQETLRILIEDHKLSYKKIAGMVGVSVRAVRSWLSPIGSSNHRRIREVYLKLLRIKCARIKK